MRRMQQAFEEKNDGIMDREMYEMMVSQYRQDKESLSEEISVLEAMINVSDDTDEKVAEWMNRIKECLEIDGLNREILSALIDKIVVHERKLVDGVLQQQVEIHYKFIGDALNSEASA